MMGFTRSFALLLVLFAAGCNHVALSLPQLEAARAFVSAPRGEVDLEAFEWTLTWGGESAPVVPVIVEDAFIFTNPGGAAVSFNGWQIFRVAGLLPRGALERSVAEDGTHLIYAGDLLLVEGRCEPWVRVPFEDGSFEWRQHCAPFEGENRLRIDNAGNMVEIEFTVHPAYAPLRLQRRESGGATG